MYVWIIQEGRQGDFTHNFGKAPYNSHTHRPHELHDSLDPHLADILRNKIVETCKQMPTTSLKYQENSVPSILPYTYAMSKAAGMANKTADNNQRTLNFLKTVLQNA